MKWMSDVMNNRPLDRRSFLGAAIGTCAIGPPLMPSFMQLAVSLSNSLTKEQRDSLTPGQVTDELKKGNERFRSGKMANHVDVGQKRSSAVGQYPAAVVLGCLNSRVSAEIVFD